MLQEDLHEPGGARTAAAPERPTAPVGAPAPTRTEPAIGDRLRRAAAASLVLGVVLRLVTRSELWLDEVLSINIATLPPSQIGDALRQDGAPPFYYALLHGWTAVFGDGAWATRALSATFSLAALPLAFAAGRRLGDRRTGWTAVLLLASSPFAVRYATEVRMYALVQLLVLAGYLLLRRALERPTPHRLAPLGVVAGLLALTHYWALFLLVATAVALLVLRRDRRQRAPADACLAALAAGGLLFAPWAPSFLFQLRHTGNPWNPPAEVVPGLLTAFAHFGGSIDPLQAVLGTILGGLTLAAAFGHRLRRNGAGGVARAAEAWPAGAPEAAVALGALLLGLVASGASGAAFSSRYASAMFPLFVLAAAVAARSIRPTALRHGLLGVAVAVGLVGGLQNAVNSRTQAGEVAAAIVARAEPGDVVAYCPDQLGPAVDRLLPDWLHQLTYPLGGSPERVDWVDYAERNRTADPAVFARFADAVAGPRHTVWLVWREGYRTLGGGCERTVTALRLLRPGSSVVVTPADSGYETHYVTRSPGS